MSEIAARRDYIARGKTAAAANTGRVFGAKKHIDPASVFLKGITFAGAFLTVSVLLLIIAFVLVNGLPNIHADLFELSYNSENCSVLPAILNTAEMTLLSLLAAVPAGILAAVFLVEYADNTGKIVAWIRITAETLSGIPSIVYGLFGLLFFSTACGLGYSMLSGSLTLAIMILPLIMRTSEEALKSVPVSYREASFGLGAGKLRTILQVVIPPAMPGILSGIILATGRIVGETAALLYTAGTVAQIAGISDSGRTLAVHMYVLSTEGLHIDKAYATAVVLLAMVFVINRLSELAAFRKKPGSFRGKRG